MVPQLAHNQQNVGSSPTPATNLPVGCSERGCVFPAPLGGLCAHHRRMFELPQVEHAHRLVGHGTTRNGTHRLRCVLCGKSFSHSPVDKRPLEYSYLPVGLVHRLVEFYRRGGSIRKTARCLGIAKDTVSTAFRRLKGRVSRADCACGRPAGHLGWCRVRFQKSQKRQTFMRRWHEPGIAVPA